MKPILFHCEKGDHLVSRDDAECVGTEWRCPIHDIPDDEQTTLLADGGHSHYCEDCDEPLSLLYDDRENDVPVVCGHCGGTNTHPIRADGGDYHVDGSAIQYLDADHLLEMAEEQVDHERARELIRDARQLERGEQS